LGAVLFIWIAATNDRGLILYCIPFTKDGATIFYWLMAVVFAVAAVVLLVPGLAGMGAPQRIAFTREGLVVPRSASSTEEELIHYASISNIATGTGDNGRVARIRHYAGEFYLHQSGLRDASTFDEILQTLAARVQAAHSSP
jgi:hypothetical protein